MKWEKYLANLGYGTRREMQQMLTSGRVTLRNGRALETDAQAAHEDILVDGEPLDPPPGSVLMLHKPVGYVCSTNEASRLIYELLPLRFRDRSPVMAPVGRLDRDTSGLLILTDDGQLNHRLTSPRKHVPKVYVAELAHELSGTEVEVFASGELMLENETTALRPAKLVVLGHRVAQLTLAEGRYHQVRRMFAAVGNHVEALHRIAIGSLGLGDLPMGEWRKLEAQEVSLLTSWPAVP
jgi:16S rRNA pseudouridine516 synthase